MIELNNVSKTYHEKTIATEVLKNINLTVNKGEFVCIYGKSGCGKTTLLNILGLLDNYESGTYILNNTKITDIGKKEKTTIRAQEIGFIFQAFHLISMLNVIENIEVPLGYAGVPGSERKRRASELIEKLELTDRKHFMPAQLSGGEKQRVAIARALITDPQIVLADEPTGNLDSRTGINIMEILKQMNREGKTIIMVTHDISLSDYATRVITMQDGKIIES